MIEIAWKDSTFTIQHVTNLLAWLLNEIYNQKEDIDRFYFTGYLVCYDVQGNLHSIILCEGENQKKVLEKLKQPPGEFIGKYVACVRDVDDHEPVVEKKHEDDDTSDEKEIKSEKT